MPIKPEEAIAYIGLDLSKYEDEDAFKSEFDGTWVKVENAAKDANVHKKVLGAANGKMRSTLKKLVKAVGVDGLEIGDDANPSELMEQLAEILPKKQSEIVAEFETKLKGATSDKAAKEWEAKYGEVQKKLTDTEKLHQEIAGQYTELQASIKTKEFQSKQDSYWNDALSKVKFRQDVNELTKNGFIAKMKEQYQVLADNEGALYTAGKDGNRIVDKKKSQTFRDLGDLLAEHASEYKLDQTNHQAGNVVNRTIAGNNGTTPQTPPAGNPVRQVHPGRQYVASR